MKMSPIIFFKKIPFSLFSLINCLLFFNLKAYKFY